MWPELFTPHFHSAFLFFPRLHRPQEAARVQRQRQVRITFTGSKRQTVIGIEWEAQRHRKKCKTEAIDCGLRACVAGRRLRETKFNIYVQDTRSQLQQLKRPKEKGTERKWTNERGGSAGGGSFDSPCVFKWEVNLIRLAGKGRSRWKADENFPCEAKQNNIDY